MLVSHILSAKKLMRIAMCCGECLSSQSLSCHDAAPVNEETLQQMHPLQALLRTLLPWVNAGETPDYAAEDAAAVPGRHPEGEMDREATEALALQIQAAYEELQAEQDNNEQDHARDRH
jgi:hypothetical protein